MSVGAFDDGSIRLANHQQSLFWRTASQDGRHTVIQGDATSCGFRAVPGGADVVFAEPPGVHPTSTINETQNFFRDFFIALNFNVKKNAALFLLPRDRKGHPFLKSSIAISVAQEFGWNVFRRFIWQWGRAGFHRASYSCHDVVAFRRGNMPAQPSPVRYKDIIFIPRPKSTSQYVQEIPLEVPLSFLPLFTKPEMVVYDPFAGSGVVLDACVKLGYRSVSLELEPLRAERLSSRVLSL